LLNAAIITWEHRASSIEHRELAIR